LRLPRNQRSTSTISLGRDAIAYRAAQRNGQTYVAIWPEALAVGGELPKLPLWLGPELCLPLRLQAGYTAACRSLRIHR